MKSIFFFGSKLKVYLLELPLVFLLILSIIYNEGSKALFKLYPLIVALSLGIVFIFIYFLRLLRVRLDEVRCIGLFSSHDNISLKKNRRLVITDKGRGRLLVEVFGIGEAPTLDWVNPEDYLDKEINLFRSRAYGTKRKLRRLLKLFGITSDFDKIFAEENFQKDFNDISLVTRQNQLGKEISLRFNETI